jgi:ADP-heptose:LPS heptosyltransferase
LNPPQSSKIPANAKILVLQLKRIGDLILTAPALAALKAGLPGARITVLTDSIPGRLLPALPCEEGHARGAPGFWRAALAGRYDAVLDFTGTDRSAALTLISRAGIRVTYARFGKKWPNRFFYNRWIDSSVRERHTIDHHMDLLAAVCEGAVDAGSGLDILPEERQKAGGLLEGAGIHTPYAVIHPGTARPEKEWPPENWAHVAKELLAAGMNVAVTGSADPAERVQVAEVVARAPGTIDLAGRFTLLELAAVIEGAGIFCGVDSAAMHMAGAVGTPCVALFGPTNPFHWQPRNPSCRIIRSQTMPPFLPSQKGGPMADIPPKDAILAIHNLLDQPSDRGNRERLRPRCRR